MGVSDFPIEEIIVKLRSSLVLAFISLGFVASAPRSSAQAAVSFSPTSLTFGNVEVGASSAPQSITLTNTGTGSLTITKIQMTSPNAPDFSLAPAGDCPISPSTLAAGAHCTINVTFNPTARGARSANVAVTDNAAGSPQKVLVKGTGLAPVVTVNPP